MTIFNDLVNILLNDCIDHLGGELFLYKDKEIKGIFDTSHILGTLGDTEVSVQQPVLKINANTINFEIARGEKIQRKSNKECFVVVDYHLDSGHELKIFLNKVENSNATSKNLFN